MVELFITESPFIINNDLLTSGKIKVRTSLEYVDVAIAGNNHINKISFLKKSYSIVIIGNCIIDEMYIHAGDITSKSDCVIRHLTITHSWELNTNKLEIQHLNIISLRGNINGEYIESIRVNRAYDDLVVNTNMKCLWRNSLPSNVMFNLTQSNLRDIGLYRCTLLGVHDKCERLKIYSDQIVDFNNFPNLKTLIVYPRSHFEVDLTESTSKLIIFKTYDDVDFSNARLDQITQKIIFRSSDSSIFEYRPMSDDIQFTCRCYGGGNCKSGLSWCGMATYGYSNFGKYRDLSIYDLSMRSRKKSAKSF